jgi:hypothetical protein
VRENVNWAAPLWQNCTNEWSTTGAFRTEILDTNALLPVTKLPFPPDLYALDVGAGYKHLFDNGWILGGHLGVGSASDEPFDTFHEVTVRADAFLQIPVVQRDALIISLNYSNNVDFLNNLPVPGIAYLWRPNDWFQALIGFPYARVWVRPMEDLTVEVSYHWLYTVQGRVTYHWTPRLWNYVGYSIGDESWFLVESVISEGRLFYHEQRVYGGLGIGIAHNISLDLYGGFAFDRFYMEGQNYRPNDPNRLDVGDGPFAALGVHLRF